MALLGINPNKLRACEYLVDHHEKQGRKIVVFSDQLYVLALYSKKLKKPAITVDTSKGERTYILREFRHGEKVDTIFVSEIDYSNVDVEADVVIQLCYEELIAVNAQPLGLLLGGKICTGVIFSPIIEATSGDGGLNPLYFYFLVSDDEIDWFDKWKEFYVHQGYALEASPSDIVGSPLRPPSDTEPAGRPSDRENQWILRRMRVNVATGDRRDHRLAAIQSAGDAYSSPEEQPNCGGGTSGTKEYRQRRISGFRPPPRGYPIRMGGGSAMKKAEH
ncbi:uncharacterized protein A4U43_C01F32520 [Asparagus officinalis]|uniref:ERCC3/RAD25/XPB helicase C-terminal domain-containing protein n=1 Tax=Asparagus officinalis TaxID=4686 RepID=A0A5P1FUI6_ASPOF|nr:uncharacterized protein A4U43_C01F32520 [Asparagus officinalis]